MRLRRLGPSLTLLLALAARAAAQVPSPLPPEKIQLIEAAVSKEMSRRGIPGLTLAVVVDNEVRFTSGYGLADLENFVPAKIDTVYRFASLSKPMTAAAVLLLAEQGKIDLEAPIQKYVPAFPEKAWPVTGRHLLCHQSGIRHYAEGEITSTKHYESLGDALEMFRDSPLAFEPGTKTLYSTYGYNLLGCAVEGASGMSFVDYLRENLFEPAGMTRARVDDAFEVILNRAPGYTRNPGGELRNAALADTSNKIPGGGLCGTATDVAKFAIALQTGALLKKESLERMLTRQRTRDGKFTGFGLGFVVSDRRVPREVWHTGGQPRVSAVLYMQPEARLAVVILANLEGLGESLRDLARHIAAIAEP